MGINEPFRCIVAGHRLLIILFVVAPMAVVFALGARSAHDYVASARIQATADTLGSDTEADSVLNRVLGIATSTDIVATAMRDAGITGRSAANVAAHDVTVNRLGSSPVVDIDVTDRSPKTAEALASALAKEVVRFLRGSSSASSDQLLTQLQAKERTATRKRQAAALALASATTPTAKAQYSSQVANFNQQLSDLSGAVQQLELVIATDSSAAVIANSSSASQVTSNLALRLILAGVGGLVAGLLIASLIEVSRPRMADARAVAREFDAPILGPLSIQRAAAQGRWSPARLRRRRRNTKPFRPAASLDAGAILALRKSAANARIGTLALVGVPKDEAEGLAKALTRALDAPVASSNGRTRSESAPRPAGGGNVRQATRTATAIKQVIATQPAGAIRVVTVEHIGAGAPGERYGLLVVGRRLMPASEVRRISDLAGATDWPVVGVLDVDAPRGREKS